MKKTFILWASFMVAAVFAQDGAPAAPYYNGFNFVQTGTSLKAALATKLTATHTNILTYAEAEKAIQVTDLDPEDTSNQNLLLLYGFSANMCPASPGDDNDHRRRNKNSDGGGAVCEWNREHTYARSLGTPNLSSTAANSDVHHLRACDVQRNGQRDNLKFGPGSGNSKIVSSLWYPGDEWKGDVARMMMYMYLRYGSQCLPSGVAVGTSNTLDTSMINLLLQWNAEDPVSQYEDNRNTYLSNTSNQYGQGNRNPFIDNPYLATMIWGGPMAQNRWPALAVSQFDLLASVSVYPNPSYDHNINITTEAPLETIELVTINGQLMQRISKPSLVNNTYTIQNLPSGFYFLKLTSDNKTITKKVLIN